MRLTRLNALSRLFEGGFAHLKAQQTAQDPQKALKIANREGMQTNANSRVRKQWRPVSKIRGSVCRDTRNKNVSPQSATQGAGARAERSRE